MFNDGIMPDWEFEKLCQQFHPHYIGYYGMDKDLWKKFHELFGEGSATKKSNTKSKTEQPSTSKSAKPVKPQVNHEEDEDKREMPEDFLKTLWSVLTGMEDDVPKGKHEKSELPKMSPELKEYMDKKSKVNLTDKTKSTSTKGEKNMHTITITLTNGKTSTWTSDHYDNYKLVDGCFVIMMNGAYVGIYNMRYITSIVVR